MSELSKAIEDAETASLDELDTLVDMAFKAYRSSIDGHKYAGQQEKGRANKLVQELTKLINSADDIVVMRMPNSFESRFVHQQLEDAILLLNRY